MATTIITENVEVIARDADLQDPRLNFYGFTNGKRTIIFRTRNQSIAYGYLIMRVQHGFEDFAPLLDGQPLHLEGYGA